MRAKYRLDFNVPNETVTGVVQVVYVKDEQDEWHVVSGADPTSLEPDSQAIVEVRGNSKELEQAAQDELTITLDEEVPVSTQGRRAVGLFVNLPTEDEKVPSDPTKAGFGVPYP